MTTAAPLFIRSETPTILAMGLASNMATDTQRTAVIVANFVRHLLQTTVRETQEKMDCRGF